MSLTILDIVVIVVVLISAILAMVRGFVREVLSIASWVIAAAAAYFIYPTLLPLVTPYIENEQVAIIASAAVIFFIALVIASYITMKIADLVIDSRAGAVDRLLGFVFGAARGLLLAVIAFMGFMLLVSNRPEWITNAQTRPLLTSVSSVIASVLPDEFEETVTRALSDNPDAPPPPAASNPAGVAPPAAVAPVPPPPAPPPPVLTPAQPPAGGLAPANEDRDRLNQFFQNLNPPLPVAPVSPTPPPPQQ